MSAVQEDQQKNNIRVIRDLVPGNIPIYTKNMKCKKRDERDYGETLSTSDESIVSKVERREIRHFRGAPVRILALCQELVNSV